MVLKGKNITAVLVILVVCVSVYLNWSYGRNDPLDESGKVLGDATLVNAEDFSELSDYQQQTGADLDYFAQAKLLRQKSRDESIGLLTMVVDDENALEESKREAAAQISEIASWLEKESKIENLIKAKGFAECVSYISGDIVQIIVKSPTDGLIGSDISKIKDIVLSEVQTTSANIRVAEIK